MSHGQHGFGFNITCSLPAMQGLFPLETAADAWQGRLPAPSHRPGWKPEESPEFLQKQRLHNSGSPARIRADETAGTTPNRDDDPLTGRYTGFRKLSVLLDRSRQHYGHSSHRDDGGGRGIGGAATETETYIHCTYEQDGEPSTKLSSGNAGARPCGDNHYAGRLRRRR